MATKPTPIRLDEQTVKRLDEAANRLGSNRAAIIRLCTRTFLDHFESHGGIASLPLDWREILRSMDGRTSAAQIPSGQGDNVLRRSMAVEAPSQRPCPHRKGNYSKTRKRKHTSS